MRRILLFFLLFCTINNAIAQDTAVKTEEHIVVTAVRNQTSKNQVAVPVLVINKSQIQNIGALKLSDLLTEQSGFFLTNGSGSRAIGGGIFGNGVQLQGMSPEHVLLLIDGEPVIGRNGGILDVSRIAIGNVKQIEIVKGPFSSLYGSEALGGVINIITENPVQNQYKINARIGSFGTMDIQNQFFLKRKNTALSFNINNYTSKGYDLITTDVERTQEANNNHTAQLKLYKTIKNGEVQLHSRYYFAQQQSKYAINSAAINVAGSGFTNETANFLSYKKQFSNKWKMHFNVQYNVYSYNQQLDSLLNGKLYYKDNFKQFFFRAEQLHNIKINTTHEIIAGFGFTTITIQSDRYSNKASQNAYHAFIQHEWKALGTFRVSSGVRYDYNTDFAATVNPKIAIKKSINSNTNLFFSAGMGFKAPDFRQLYLSFINNASDSYIIYGTENFSLKNLQQQLNTGFIAQILPAANTIAQLKPEKSLGLNIGATYNKQPLKLNGSLFYNKINNLIQFVEVAKRANGASVFSYVNINKAFTTGAELQTQLTISKKWVAEVNYQYLKSADVTIWKNIKNKNVFGRDGIGTTARKLLLKDYTNLQGRSTHMLQAKLNYLHKKWQYTARAIFRGKWGVQDYDGNGIANMKAEYAKANIILNTSAVYKLNTATEFRLGINNLTNYKDAFYMTNISSRNFYITIQYSIKQK